MLRHRNCPYCQSEKTFIAIHPNPMGKRFCNNCGQNYDRSDELRLRRKKKVKITNFKKEEWTNSRVKNLAAFRPLRPSVDQVNQAP